MCGGEATGTGASVGQNSQYSGFDDVKADQQHWWRSSDRGGVVHPTMGRSVCVDTGLHQDRAKVDGRGKKGASAQPFLFGALEFGARVGDKKHCLPPMFDAGRSGFSKNTPWFPDDTPDYILASDCSGTPMVSDPKSKRRRLAREVEKGAVDNLGHGGVWWESSENCGFSDHRRHEEVCGSGVPCWCEYERKLMVEDIVERVTKRIVRRVGGKIDALEEKLDGLVAVLGEKRVPRAGTTNAPGSWIGPNDVA